MPRSFIKNVKERREGFVLFITNTKECENVLFFLKERKRKERKKARKRTQRMFCSFAKNVKESKKVSFFCKRMQKNANLIKRTLRSFTFFFVRFAIFVWLMKTKRAQRSFALFYNERKRTQRTPRSFIKNVKEHKELHVLL